MFTVGMDGSDKYILDPSGFTSHFIWRDPQHICAWTKPAGRPEAFYLFRDQSNEVQPVGEGMMTHNGHNTYLPLPGNEWILNDTYPDPRTRAHKHCTCSTSRPAAASIWATSRRPSSTPASGGATCIPGPATNIDWSPSIHLTPATADRSI